MLRQLFWRVGTGQQSGALLRRYVIGIRVALSWCLFSEMGAEAGTCGSKADVCFLLRCLGAKGRSIQPHMANGLAGDFRCCCNSHAHLDFRTGRDKCFQYFPEKLDDMPWTVDGNEEFGDGLKATIKPLEKTKDKQSSCTAKNFVEGWREGEDCGGIPISR